MLAFKKSNEIGKWVTRMFLHTIHDHLPISISLKKSFADEYASLKTFPLSSVSVR